MKMNSITVAAIISLLSSASLLADENEWFKPLGEPPQANPRRISGGEGIGLLPGPPVTPLRRTERKREPSPPKLIGKVVWGESAAFTYANGTKTEITDWNLCPADLQQLLRKVNRDLSQTYTCDTVNLDNFDGDSVKMPVLFFSGTRSIRLTEKQLALLHRYVVDGGTIIGDSVAGSPYFYDAFKQAMNKAFPESSLRVVPLDHPVYHMLEDVTQVNNAKNVAGNRPEMDAIYVGCRIGVLISKYGLGCGWDDHPVPLLPKAAYYDTRSANLLGINLVGYLLGYANVGRDEAKPELFGAVDEKRPTDEFVFGQIKHDGHWNVHPGAAAALLRVVQRNTSILTSLKRIPVTPGKDDISKLNFLYLTGLDDFQWDAAAVSALKTFLAHNGTLVINNGLGLNTFDSAVRREIKKIAPDVSLRAIPPTHPLYSTVFKIGEVQYTPAVMKEHKELRAPYLEGISMNGDLRVIYSPFDIEAGWENEEFPLARAYESSSAVPLGVNLIMYAMTH